MNIHVYHNYDELHEILSHLEWLRKEVKRMSQAMNDLTAEVAQDTTVIESAVTLIDGFAAQLAAAGTDPAALNALKDSLSTERQKLAAAVAANTTVAPATP